MMEEKNIILTKKVNTKRADKFQESIINSNEHKIIVEAGARFRENIFTNRTC